jgi:hypothetical protein
MLVYLDKGFDVSLPSSVGLSGVTQGGEFGYYVSTDPDFAKMLYSTLLTAQAQGKNIDITAKSVNNGYLMIDRIWLANQ